MAYIANKPVRFDRDYMIGEEIPDHVISPGRVAAIVGMGLVSPVERVERVGVADGHGEPENGTEGKQDAREDVSEVPAQVKKTRSRKKGA